MNIYQISPFRINTTTSKQQNSNKRINFTANDSFIRLIDTKTKSESITQPIKLADNIDYRLKISNETIKKYLTTNGKLDNFKLKKFIEIYKEYFKELLDEENSRKEALNSAINKKDTKITSINPQQDTTNALLISLDKKDMSESIVENIKDDEIRRAIAKRLLSIEEDFSDEKFKKAYEYTEQFFMLSKTKKGYNFSKSKEKLELLQEINLAIYMLGRDDNILQRLIDCSTEEGEINLENIEKITKLIKNSTDAQVDVEYTSKLYEKFKKLDPDNKDLILESMVKLSKGYPISKEDKCFEDAFEYSFNPKTKKFDIERFETLKEFLREAGEYFNLDADDFDAEFTRFNLFEKESLKAYFKEFTNPFTGEITSDRTNSKEFLENITK